MLSRDRCGQPGGGRGYTLTIVEKQAMVQEVVANAELFKAGLSARNRRVELLRQQVPEVRAREGAAIIHREVSSE